MPKFYDVVEYIGKATCRYFPFGEIVKEPTHAIVQAFCPYSTAIAAKSLMSIRPQLDTVVLNLMYQIRVIAGIKDIKSVCISTCTDVENACYTEDGIFIYAEKHFDSRIKKDFIEFRVGLVV